jgi:NADH-quinone oxidoreductase subunit E
VSGHEFQSFFPESGSVDYTDTVENIDETIASCASSRPLPAAALGAAADAAPGAVGRRPRLTPGHRGLRRGAGHHHRPGGRAWRRSTRCTSGVRPASTTWASAPPPVRGDGRRHPAGDVSEKLGVGEGETTADGMFTLERIECNAACDFAPGDDGQLGVHGQHGPESRPTSCSTTWPPGARSAVHPRRHLTGWREAERVLAGFPDGRADEGPAAGPASLLGLQIAESGVGARRPPARSPEVRRRTK